MLASLFCISLPIPSSQARNQNARKVRKSASGCNRPEDKLHFERVPRMISGFCSAHELSADSLSEREHYPLSMCCGPFLLPSCLEIMLLFWNFKTCRAKKSLSDVHR